MAPIEGRERRLDRIEAGLLLLAAPFLLFPTVAPAGTVAALASISLIWLLRPAVSRQPLVRTPFNVPLLLFLLTVLIGILVSADPDLTLPKAAGLLLGITLWRTLAVQVRSSSALQWATGLFLAAALGMVAVGAASADWREKAPLLAVVTARLPERSLQLPENQPAGTHANELAGTVLLCLPLAAAVLALVRGGQSAPSGPQGRVLAILATAVALTGGLLLVLSQSRAGWLGGAAGVVALGWLGWARRQAWTRPQSRRWLILGATAGFGLAATVPLAYRWAATRATLGAAGPLETLAFRFEIWRYALEAVGDFPLTGTGLGAFRRVVLRLYPITAFPNPDVAHAHNVFLQVALDVGLPGLIAYLALLAAAAGVGWRWLRSGRRDRAYLAAGVLASLLAFHGFGLADTIALGGKPGLLFWWLLGLLAAGERLSGAGKEAELSSFA